MERKLLTPLSLLVRAVPFLALGVAILSAPGAVVGLLQLLCAVALALNGLPAVYVSIFHKKDPHPHSFQLGVISLLAALALCLFPNLLRGSIPFMAGLWSLLVGLTQLGYLAQLFLTKERGKLRFVLLASFSLFSAAVLLLSPEGNAYARAFAGAYMILYGLWQLVDMVGVLVNRNVESSRFLSRIRVRLPVIVTALLPSAWLRALEREQSKLTKDTVIRKAGYQPKADTDELSIFFHLGKNVAFGFGHVDISIHGRTISYGCYDESSNRLFGLLSDGVFMVAPTGPYIDYCRTAEGKLLVSFSLALSKGDGARVQEAINSVVSACQPWRHAARPEYEIGARFYKVRTGGFKLYNALTTNCAAMAECIASESGLNLLPPNGFVTPGAYFSFLQNELRDPKSNVVSQTIYAKLP